MSGVTDKVAIITGSTGGLGRSVALKLASQGARIVVNGRNKIAGEEVVRSIQVLGAEAIFIQADLLIKQQARDMVRAAIESFGHIDIMVASAGPGAAPSETGKMRQSSAVFADSDPEEVAASLVRSTLIKLNPVHAVVSHMITRQSGSILFITSQGGRVATPGQTAVSLHAGGLLMMTKVVAKELARSKIRINALAVTLVKDTPTWELFAAGGMVPLKTKVFERISKQAPYGLAKPDDVAAVAAFLVSDDAMFITGETVSATGGSSFA